MTQTNVAPAQFALFSRLQSRLSPDRVSADKDIVSLLSDDLFPDEAISPASIVVRPKTAADIATLIKVATEFGSAIVPRGGGMSYTGGYRPSPGDVMIDLRDLNAIREINTEDLYVIVEAGCTWQALSEALNGSGLRPALRGPISGSVSTVGGAASQNLPGSMDAVLGLEIVSSMGDIIKTGSMGVQGRGGFYRNYGPDLTGLFLGDAGALGVKSAIALRLEPQPDGVAHASFGFASMSDTADAMTRIAALNLGGRIFALDPLKNKTSTKVGVREGLDTLKGVVGKGGLGRGLKEAAKIAIAGQGAYDNVAWSVHMTFEGVSNRAAEEKLMRAKTICAEKGTEIEPSIPVAMYAGRYSVRGYLGLKGERWVPLHGIFPLSKAQDVVAAVERFFDERADQLEQHNVVHSYMLAANGPQFLIEPMFYWPDEILNLQRATLEERKLKKLTVYEDAPEARAWVRSARNELRDLLYGLGGVSAQIGRYYPYRAALEPETRTLMDVLKATLDPGFVLNPGALGFEKKGR